MTVTTAEYAYDPENKYHRLFWKKEVPADLLAAAAHYSVSHVEGPRSSEGKPIPMLSIRELLDQRATKEISRRANRENKPNLIGLPLNIFSGNDHRTYSVQVPIDPETNEVADPLQTWYEYYAQCGTYTDDNPVQTVDVDIQLDPNIQFPTGNLMEETQVFFDALKLDVTVVDVDVGKRALLLSLDFSAKDPGTVMWEVLWAVTRERDQVAIQGLEKELSETHYGHLQEAIDTLAERFGFQATGNVSQEFEPTSLSIVLLSPLDYYDTLSGKFVCNCQHQLLAKEIIIPRPSASTTAQRSSRGPIPFENDLSETAIRAISIANGINGTSVSKVRAMNLYSCSGAGPTVEAFTQKESLYLSVGGPSGCLDGTTHYSDVPDVGRRATKITRPFSSRALMTGEGCYLLRHSVLTII